MKSYDVKSQKMRLSVNLVIPFIIAKENVGKHFVFVTAFLETKFQFRDRKPFVMYITRHITIIFSDTEEKDSNSI